MWNPRLLLTAIALPIFQVQASVPWDGLLNESGGNRVFFGSVLEGADPFEREADTALAPASVTKIFTAASALDFLGPDFRFPTTLSWREVTAGDPARITDLTITGHGDPTFGMSEHGEDYRSRFNRYIDLLAELGVKEVIGPATTRSDDPRWEVVRFPEGWLEEDHIECFGSQAQAFNIQINCGTFVLKSPTQFGWSEEGVPTNVTVDVKWGSATELEVIPLHSDQIQSVGYEIRGTLNRTRGRESVVLYLAVHEARKWAENIFRLQLTRSQKIAYKPTLAFPDASGSPQSLEVLSPPLSEILVPFLKKSLNQNGDALFKFLGRQWGSGSEADLIAAGKVISAEYFQKISVAPVTFHDGSGVSQTNSVTPRAVMALLHYFQTWPAAQFAHLWRALPIAGVDGTLERRMKGTAAHGRLRAKTGTLTGVNNLAGFVPPLGYGGDPSKLFPFVIISRGSKTDGPTARAAIDRVGAKFSQLNDY
ncbi:MAG: D-alanyl-D-alanine carboxypeptidase/D-alanyl-D-alanine-endopeptidase [Bdellovibrionota bacterium]